MVPAEVTEFLRAALALADVDWSRADSAGLMAAADGLFTAEAITRSAQARLLAAADEIDATVEQYGRATRSYLIEEQLLNPGEASRRMKLARQLSPTSVTGEAFRIGDLSAEHALVILDVLPHVRDDALREVVEKELVELSRSQPPFVVARAVDEILARLGVEDGADAAYARRFSRRNVSLAETFGGSGSLAGTLTPEVREKLRLALTAAAQKVGPEDTRTVGQRSHDALGDIADFYLRNADLPDINGERPRVVVTMSIESLLAQLQEQWAFLPAGIAVSPATARRLACDAEFLPAVLNASGDVLDLGRTKRDFNAAIRRAAWIRDGRQCVFPKCRRPVCDLHHLVWHSLGGRTSLDNAAWLCSFHHWLVHEGGWTVHRNRDGSYTWTSPDGIERTGPPRSAEPRIPGPA